MRNSLKPITTIIFHLKLKEKNETMKITWLYKEFVFIFITGPSQDKLGRTTQQQLLLITLLGTEKNINH